MRYYRRFWRYELEKIRERALMAFVERLPRKLVYFCYIRVGVHATTGAYSNTVVPEISMMDALQRWDTPPAQQPNWHG